MPLNPQGSYAKPQELLSQHQKLRMVVEAKSSLWGFDLIGVVGLNMLLGTGRGVAEITAPSRLEEFNGFV